jgi:DNA mismatch endonuclease (patch repair protein)
MPKSNSGYWTAKFARNVERDKQVRSQLKDQGWRVLEIWECEARDAAKLSRRLARFFRLASS